MKSEFEEIAHSGGKITFSIKTDEDGCRKYQTGYKHSRPVPMTLIAVYALPQGVPVDSIQLRGIGEPWNPPPFPGCLSVFIASDSEGYFGHNCARCDGYWRSGPWPRVCPYCAVLAPSHRFLSHAQRRYVKHYCDVLTEALESDEDQEVEIDMDAVADAAGKQSKKQAFYVAEVSQQQKFNCVACGEFNDILGRFGYCALCGTRNDYAEFETEMIPAVRARLNSGTPPEDCVRDAVASFDSFTGQLVKELAKIVPMTPRRKKRLLGQRYHNIEEVAERLDRWFDIDIKKGIETDKWRKVGATDIVPPQGGDNTVSILAHPERWALRSKCVRRSTSCICFNPRPPRKVGATVLVPSSCSFCWCFNPRPPRKVGATQGARITAITIEVFQSSPTPEGGALQKSRCPFAQSTTGFNPRPPRKVGATGRFYKG